jgi:16S rRNA (uracil1498-N3)-methyltransferase
MVTGNIARIAGSEFHHMCTVMRLTSGALVRVLCDDGVEYEGRIDRINRDYAIVKIDQSSPHDTRPSRRMIIAPALIKAARMDFLVEKAAELGASELWPLICSRSVVRDPGAERLARWRRLAASAAKQSFAPTTMQIRAPLEVCALSGNILADALRIVCDSDGDPLGAIVKRAAPPAILLACGPEGGFAPTETGSAVRPRPWRRSQSRPPRSMKSTEVIETCPTSSRS